MREDYVVKKLLSEFNENLTENQINELETTSPLNIYVTDGKNDSENVNLIEICDKIIFEENSLFKQNLDIILLLMDLLLYKNEELVQNSFILIFKSFSKKSSLISYLNQIQLIENAEEVEIYEILLKIKEKLQFFSDSSEKWVVEDKQLITDEVILKLDDLEDLLIHGKLIEAINYKEDNNEVKYILFFFNKI